MLYFADLELPQFFVDLEKSLPFSSDSNDTIMIAIKSAYQMSLHKGQDFLMPIGAKDNLTMYVIQKNNSEVLGYQMPVEPIPILRDFQIMSCIQTFSREYNLYYCSKVSEIFCSSLMSEEMIPEIVFGRNNGEAH